MSTLALLAFAQVAVGGVPLKPADFLDGRTIASGTGQPIVMLTLSPAVAARLKRDTVTLDGKPVEARVANNTVEIDGQPDFAAAAKLALAITGKPPLPDSLDE